MIERSDGIIDDVPIPFFPLLAETYPTAKFILTQRDKASWLASMKTHWGGKKNPDDPDLLAFRLALRHEVYGCTAFDRDVLSERFDRHHRAVDAFFAACPGRLLRLNLIERNGWPPLCEFLGCPPVDHPFPWLGRAR
ncbi:MAG: sulfotransferase [Verrucomicrobiota bacterium]